MGAPLKAARASSRVSRRQRISLYETEYAGEEMKEAGARARNQKAAYSPGFGANVTDAALSAAARAGLINTKTLSNFAMIRCMACINANA